MKRKPGISRRKLLWGAFLGTPVAAVVDGLAVEPEWLRVRKVRMGQSPSPVRLVQFTDLHHRGDRAYLQRVVKRINGLKPDVVCFTGDLVEESEFVAEALELIQQIHVPVYGVPGNHDYWAHVDFAQIARAFAATGGRWLMDAETVALKGKLQIIGLTCGKAVTFAPRPGMKTVVMHHYPDWISRLSPHRYDLLLAGHSHGGQVRLPFYGALLVPFGVGEFELGLYETPSGPLYVSAGIGYFYMNVRFFCRPEITLFEL